MISVYVAYAHVKDSKCGFGSAVLDLDSPIKGWKEISEIESLILRGDGADQITILNWKVLET